MDSWKIQLKSTENEKKNVDNIETWKPDLSGINVELADAVPLCWVPGQARIFPEQSEPGMASQDLYARQQNGFSISKLLRIQRKLRRNSFF